MIVVDRLSVHVAKNAPVDKVTYQAHHPGDMLTLDLLESLINHLTIEVQFREVKRLLECGWTSMHP